MAGATHKEEFIYLASHQLRNPVTRIKWMIELLLRSEKLTKRTKEYLTLIHTSTVRLNDLITVLLNVSRIERGKMVFSPHSLDLVRFVKNFLKDYVSFSAKKNISIILKKHPPALPAVIDSAAFYNILQPLVLNAIEYTPKGGRIEVSLEKSKETFCLMVRDNGIGIPKKDQRHIFEKFTRASNAKAINQDGLGLGLYAASQTVELLEGKIWFDSKKDKGTTFYVKLPLTHTNP
jgi:signal transduction histidine kinase